MVSAYAPVSGKGAEPEKERERFWKQLGQVSSRAPRECRLIVGGDMNAEVGAAKDNEFREVMGGNGTRKRTDTGKNSIDFCTEAGMLIAGTFFKQKERATWWHLRYGSAHELDHFLIRQSDRWYLEGCKTLHFGRTLAGKATRKKRRIEPPKVQRPDGVIAWS